MLINFAHDGLVSIQCDCLEFDGHGVKNLIDVKKTQRAKGFLADRFIKPPANISLLFKCNVDISKIVLNPRVGGQKSAGFEILKVFRNQSTISLAQTVIKDGAEVVLFCRPDDSGASEGVRFCSGRAADRVREIRLRIFKTSGSTVPALGALDIWGKPSQNVPQTVRNEVISTWTSICHPETDKPQTKDPEPTSKSSSSVLNADLVIPEEFIDPISCEIMTIPMTLPSGNIVDVSTLEKFNESQAKLGRPIGCDPFTGVLFTENNKPVFATALKSRLDKFLLDNSEAPSIKTLPRTLGRKSNLVSSSVHESSSSTVVTSKRTISVCERSNIQTVDDLLVDCLDGLPSYVDTNAPQPKKARTGCARCSKTASPGENEYFYKLPCQDVVCRECLCSMKKRQDNRCAECSKQFDFSAVVRHHIERLSSWKLSV